MEKKNVENSSNIDRLLYLEQQKNMIEIARNSIEKFKEITELQRQVMTLNHEKWGKMDSLTEPLQEDIDWYVKEYIIPIQERQLELAKLENSLITIPQRQGIAGKIGKVFERFIPGITKEGRQRRSIANKKQTIEDEIDTYKTMAEKNPFGIFGANKDIKGKILEKMDITQLDKYATIQNDSKNYLKLNSSVKSIVDSIKREDMISLLDSYPILEEEATHLVSELINNGMEGFNKRVEQVIKDSVRKKNELIPQIHFEAQEESEKDILDRITQQIKSIMNNLTPDELEEIKKREQQDKVVNELE